MRNSIKKEQLLMGLEFVHMEKLKLMQLVINLVWYLSLLLGINIKLY
jgi:hypothetical protein